MDAKTLYSLGTALVLAGIIIIAVATALILRRKNGKAVGVRGGGVIVIGPIPIVFGTDKESLKTIMLLSIILTVLLIALVIALHFLSN